MSDLHLAIVVEGDLDEAILKKLIAQCAPKVIPSSIYGKKGRDFIRQKILSFRQAAEKLPFLVLVDLDRDACPPELIRDWLPDGPGYLTFRVAVRSIEAWLMADRDAFAGFIGVSPSRVPLDPEGAVTPKLSLINLARNSNKRDIREDLVPPVGGTSKVGKNYNGRLLKFVTGTWSAERAGKRSRSLAKAIQRIRELAPD